MLRVGYSYCCGAKMSIKLRGDIWHCDFTCASGQRIRQSLGTADKREAQELHDQLKASYWRIDRLGDFPRKTFDDACVRWVEEKQHKKSLPTDKSIMKFWLEVFGGQQLSSITAVKIYSAMSKMKNRAYERNWKAHKQKSLASGEKCGQYVPRNVSTATKNAHLAFIRALLRLCATEWGWLEKAPPLKSVKVDNKRIRWLTKTEAHRLIDELPDYFKPLVIFALATGLRRSNITDLEWSQVDLGRKVAWIHPEQAKSGRAIGIALNDTACKVLQAQQGRHEQWVFVQKVMRKRKILTTKKFNVDSNKAWRAALKRASIKDFRFHDLRHTWASWLVQSGVPLTILQEMGGWESAVMVQRYAHLSPEHLAEHAQKLDAFFQ